MRHSQNPPLPLRVYPFLQQLYAPLPESTPPSRNPPPPLFQQIYIWDPPRIYPSLSEIHLFQQICATLQGSIPPCQNLDPFSTTIIICDAPKIYPSLPEYSPPPSRSTTMCDTPRIYPSLTEYTPFSTTLLCDPPIIHLSLPEYRRRVDNIA